MPTGFESTTLPGHTPPESAADQLARQARLARLAGPGELAGALLALLLGGGRRELQVWHDECQALPERQALLSDVQALTPAQRLPWAERLAQAMARHGAEPRRALLKAARRLLAADGRTTALDRLRWLGLRHALAGERLPLADTPAAAAAELEAAPPELAHAVARLSAYLSRLVPQPEPDLDVGDDALPPGLLWWRAVTACWPTLATDRSMPDSDALVQALQAVQSLPWLQRPVLVRRWVDAAQVLSPPSGLHPVAAEALRLGARLLDSPLPPALAACFEEPDQDPR
jgi:hypothetical protein